MERKQNYLKIIELPKIRSEAPRKTTSNLYQDLIHHPQYNVDQWHACLDAKKAELIGNRPETVLSLTPEQLADLMTKEIMKSQFQLPQPLIPENKKQLPSMFYGGVTLGGSIIGGIFAYLFTGEMSSAAVLALANGAASPVVYWAGEKFNLQN